MKVLQLMRKFTFGERDDNEIRTMMTRCISILLQILNWTHIAISDTKENFVFFDFNNKSIS